jgi:hypothetical protein
LTVVSEASAQVIECPGALPAAALERDETLKLAERQLQRFSAALDLHGLSAINEQAILENHRDHPDQLLTKLTYLTLQCQMVLLDDALAAEDRRRAIRRVFLDYALQPADPSAQSLADYVNAIATSGSAADTNDLEAEIGRVEFILRRSDRRQWQERWFLPPAREENGQPAGRWSVIIASPRYEDDGWTTLRRYQEAHPDIHFELDGPFDQQSPHYAVLAGRNLGQNTANELLNQLKAKGLPQDSYIWRAPAGNGSS